MKFLKTARYNELMQQSTALEALRRIPDTADMAAVRELPGEIQNLVVKIGQLYTTSYQNKQEPEYAANRFTTYESWINNIHSCCQGKDPFGLWVVSLIYKRAGWIAGTLEYDCQDEDREREVAFAKEFFRFNNLQEAGLIDRIANVDKEGKVLHWLVKMVAHKWTWKDSKGTMHNETGMIKARYMTFSRYQYKVYATPEKLPTPQEPDTWMDQTNPLDPDEPFMVTYEKKGTGPQKELVKIPKEEFVYAHYRGDDYSQDGTGSINSAMSVWWVCWENVLGLEKCCTDMRMNNHLYAAPRPVIECKDAQTAKETNNLVNANTGGINLMARKLLVIVGTLRYPTPDDKAALDNEIKTHTQMISMATGIPPHQLGRDDELRTRAVSNSMMEGLGASILMDRQIAEKWMNELLRKAIAMMNGTLTPLDPEAVTVRIGSITDADWNRLTGFWTEARTQGHISSETFLEQIPGLDVSQEKQRLEEEQKQKQEEQQQKQEEFITKMLNKPNQDTEPDQNQNDETTIDNSRAEQVEKQKLLNQKQNQKGGSNAETKKIPGR